MIWMIHFIGLMVFNVTMHDFHLSKSTVNYDEPSSTIQVSTHLFIDDLEVALGNKTLNIGTDKEDRYADLYIAEYIEKHFLFIASDTLKYQFLGKEVSQDYTAVWCYFEVPVDTPAKLTVVNNVLIETFMDQQNLVTFQKHGERVSDKIYNISDFSSTFDLR